MLTVVTYHYVRALEGSGFPRLKARTLESFKGQLDYIARHYTVVGIRNVIAAVDGVPLPTNALLLTFDDGLRDHATNVLPQLKSRGMVGCFFVPTSVLTQRTLLSVHKLHCVLAMAEHPSSLLQTLFAYLRPWRSSVALPSDEELFQRFGSGTPFRFDTPEVACVKTLLQRELPSEVRENILDALFESVVHRDEGEVAGEFYMNSDDLRALLDSGMDIGGHGTTHRWLGALSKRQQQVEIDGTISMLKLFGLLPDRWAMSYPLGNYNSDTIALLKDSGCAAAFTTRQAVIESFEARYELPRLDTNDLPVDANAPQKDWTMANPRG